MLIPSRIFIPVLRYRKVSCFVSKATRCLRRRDFVPAASRHWISLGSSKLGREIVESEAILRTRIVFIEKIGFVQVVVRSGGEIPWTAALSIGDLPKTHRELPPHDGGILSRYAIIGGDTGQPQFAWTAHHALYDGWSLPTLLSRVETEDIDTLGHL